VLAFQGGKAIFKLAAFGAQLHELLMRLLDHLEGPNCVLSACE
jgi:hypothetical protein